MTFWVSQNGMPLMMTLRMFFDWPRPKRTASLRSLSMLPSTTERLLSRHCRGDETFASKSTNQCVKIQASAVSWTGSGTTRPLAS
jgi:hypothetical protein